MVLPLGDLHRTLIVPYVTYGLIAINVAVFLVQQQKGEEFTLAFAATPYEITHNEDLAGPVPKVVTVRVRDPFGRGIRVEQRQVDLRHIPCPVPVRWTLLTSMFLHGSWMHLIGNMLYLWIVGDNVEEVLGSVRYLIVYFACGLAGSVAQIAIDPDSVTPTLGASGAIAGIMGSYVIWFPHNQIRVLLFRFITVLPAIIVIGGWIALQIWLGYNSLGAGKEQGGWLTWPMWGARSPASSSPCFFSKTPATSRIEMPPRKAGPCMRNDEDTNPCAASPGRLI